MGYMRNHSILVSASQDRIGDAHAAALRVFEDLAPVSNVSPSPTNDVSSFVVFPDGSKEGWATSDTADAAREAFTGWLREYSWADWVEVQWGDDEGDSRVLQHDADERSPA